jgi:hypothetical protein
VRFSGSAITLYCGSNTYGTPGLFRFASGSATFLGYTGSHTNASGDLWHTQCDGSTIRVDVAESVYKEATDTTISSGVLVGIGGDQSGNDDFYKNVFDDFWASDGLADGGKRIIGGGIL